MMLSAQIFPYESPCGIKPSYTLHKPYQDEKQMKRGVIFTM